MRPFRFLYVLKHRLQEGGTISDSGTMKKLVLVSIMVVFALTGCATPQTKTSKGATYGAVGGAIAGAVLGQAIGRNTESTLIGAAAGAAVGAAGGAGVGHMMDQQETEMRAALAESEAAAVNGKVNYWLLPLKGMSASIWVPMLCDRVFIMNWVE